MRIPVSVYTSHIHEDKSQLYDGWVIQFYNEDGEIYSIVESVNGEFYAPSIKLIKKRGEKSAKIPKKNKELLRKINRVLGEI